MAKLTIIGRLTFLALLVILFQIELQAQVNLFDISKGYTFERLIGHEPVDVEWKMSGPIQAEINEGLNNLNDGNPNVAVGNFTRALAPDSALWIAYYYRGVAYKQMGNLKRAESDFKKALQLNEKPAEALIELGKTQLLLDEHKEASGTFIKVIRDHPANYAGHYWAGEVAIDKADDAEKHFKECLEVNPAYAPARIKLSLLAITKSKNPLVGLGHLNEAIRRDSTTEEGLILRALILSEKKPKESLKDLDRLIGLSPFQTYFLATRGFLLINMQEYDKAFSDFQKVLKANVKQEGKFLGQQTIFDKQIDLQYASYYTLANVFGLPEKDIAHVKKAYCLLLIANQNEAISALKKVSNHDASPLCVFLMAIGYEHAGDHETAWKLYESALKLDNTIADAHKKVAIYNSNVGEWMKAERGFTEALKLNDQLNNLYKLRGVARYFQNNFKGAIEDFDRYLMADSADYEAKESRYFAYTKLGIKTKFPTRQLRTTIVKPTDTKIPQYSIDLNVKNFVKQGDTIQALSYINQIISKQPDRFAYMTKAKLFISIKKYDSAITILNKIITPGVLDAGALMFRASSYMGQKKYTQAANDIKTITAANSNHQKNYFDAYKGFLNQGDTASAKMVLRLFDKRWPKYTDVYMAQAELFVAAKMYDSAEYFVEKVLDDKFQNQNYSNFGKAFYIKSITRLEANDHEKALTAINKALFRESGNPDFQFQKAMVLLKSGRQTDAEKILNQLKRMNYLPALKY